MQKLRGFKPVEKQYKKHNVQVYSPSRGTKGSCGYDFPSPLNFIVMPNEKFLVWTDIKAYMLSDERLELHPRSSQRKIEVTFYGTGLIDSDYYDNAETGGNIGILIKNCGDEPYFVNEGEFIAQGVFSKYLTADADVVRSEIRVGGFGSTDRQGEEK